MFTRRSAAADSEHSDSSAIETAAGKGRPTPKRRDAQRSRQLRAKPPANRREAARLDRERRRLDRESNRKGLLAGDEKALPARDRGPVRRFARDFVDSRRSAGEYFLYIAFLIVGLSLVRVDAVRAVGTLLMIALVGVIVVDSWWLAHRLRRLLPEKFPKEDTSGVVTYAVLRSTQLRRLRLPPPQVQRGQRLP